SLGQLGSFLAAIQYFLFKQLETVFFAYLGEIQWTGLIFAFCRGSLWLYRRISNQYISFASVT
ncbi:MAG TPA: hypothetical protein VED17_00615, partial [Nitrososphaerales archaeon]|nr:hypothetical protein [Nitrososphaerales archaeon]